MPRQNSAHSAGLGFQDGTGTPVIILDTVRMGVHNAAMIGVTSVLATMGRVGVRLKGHLIVNGMILLIILFLRTVGQWINVAVAQYAQIAVQVCRAPRAVGVGLDVSFAVVKWSQVSLLTMGNRRAWPRREHREKRRL